MSATKHSPLPWSKRRIKTSRDDIFVYGIVGESEVVDGLDGIVQPDRANDRTFAEDEANIDLILEAVNSFASLQEENEALKARMAELTKVMNDVVYWASRRCPADDESVPCPLCGARADIPGDECKAVERIFPRELLRQVRAALQGGQGNG